MLIRHRLFLLLSLLIFSFSIHADQRPVIEDFTLKDIEGKSFSFSKNKKDKVIVVISYVTGCPILQRSMRFIHSLDKKHGKKGVSFFFLTTNPHETIPDLKAQMRLYDLENTRMLLDVDKKIGKAIGFTRTSEVALISVPKGEVLYKGGISDRFGYGTIKVKKGYPYLEKAIDSFLKGEKIEITETDAKGCLINYNTRK